jgi:protein ImuB
VPAGDVHARSIDFEAPESNLERLIFIVKRLIDALIAPLATAGHAVAALSLAITLDDRTTRTERVQPAAPTVEAGELVTLVRLRLDACRFQAGLVALRITADAVPAAPGARRLFPLEGRRDADAANRAFARLRAEFGDDAVVLAELGSGHLPSAQFTWTPLLAVPVRSAPHGVAVRPLVRRMYTHPIEITLDDRSALIGPYTIAGGWWAGGVHRDYYFIRTAAGECWWLYDDRRRRRCFLQGGVE